VNLVRTLGGQEVKRKYFSVLFLIIGRKKYIREKFYPKSDLEKLGFVILM